MKEMPDSDGKIRITDLISKFHSPQTHFDLCSKTCEQQLVCQLVREALVIQKDLASKIGEFFPIFKGASAFPVGSIVVGTRIGKIPDELDTSVALSRDF